LCLGFVGIAVLFEQLAVFIGARVAFFHEAFVIVLVPLFFGVFLIVLMSFDGMGEFFNELSHGLGDLPGALLVFVPRELPFRRRDRDLIVRAFDHDAAVSLAEPF